MSEYIVEQLNNIACKTYLVGRKGSNEVFLVDPLIEETENYLKMLEQRNLKLVAVFDTHAHADHISAGAKIRKATGVDYIMHNLSPVECANVHITDGDKMEIAGVPVEFIHTPGHTKDSSSIVIPGYFFSGDALFLDDGGAGRDDLPGGDPGVHYETLQRILSMDENLMVEPSHDYRQRKPTTLKAQKESNPFLKIEGKKNYILYLEDLKLGPADWMADVLKANWGCATDVDAAFIPKDEPACEVKGTMTVGQTAQPVTAIDAIQMKSVIDDDGDYVLLDVRELFELEDDLGHIPGIVHIPIWDLQHKLAEIDYAKDKELYIICRSGGRSYTAAQILEAAGFKRVYVLEGGMYAWRMAGYPASLEYAAN